MKLFTEKEAAKQIRCSASTLYRGRKENTIRHYRKIGRLIRYTQEDINLIVEESKAFRPSPVVQRSVTEARFG